MKERTLLFRECHMSFASFFQLLHNGFDALKATYQFIHYFCEFLGMPLKKKETSALRYSNLWIPPRQSVQLVYPERTRLFNWSLFSKSV